MAVTLLEAMKERPELEGAFLLHNYFDGGRVFTMRVPLDGIFKLETEWRRWAAWAESGLDIPFLVGREAYFLHPLSRKWEVTLDNLAKVKGEHRI